MYFKVLNAMYNFFYLQDAAENIQEIFDIVPIMKDTIKDLPKSAIDKVISFACPHKAKHTHDELQLNITSDWQSEKIQQKLVYLSMLL